MSQIRLLARKVSQMHYIYGLNPVLEALRAGRRRISQIYVAQGARQTRLEELMQVARRNSIPVKLEKRQTLDRFVPDASHQGVVALVRNDPASYADFDELLSEAPRHALFLILDGVEDPHNLGAVIRTAESAGVYAVVIPEHNAAGITETVVKASAGAVEYMPVSRVTNIVQTIDALKEHNIWVVGVEAGSSTEYTGWDYTTATAVVMGSEGKGIRRLVREHCDTIVSIPLAGRVNSLNVSAATAVVLYEAVRQRRLKRAE